MKKLFFDARIGENSYVAPIIEVEECMAEQGYLVSAPIEDVGKDDEVPFV
ncbi:MAG: hypothetical protein IJD27_00670 [Alistipes sp.]|nr:hypothetical protein [Alistipes sp.]